MFLRDELRVIAVWLREAYDRRLLGASIANIEKFFKQCSGGTQFWDPALY